MDPSGRRGGDGTPERRPVSPPTRGWTVAVKQLRVQGERGFPRPRGDGPLLLPDIAGFPRPRGDGPWSMVSPPTRGWTRQAGGVGERRRGFPAHAGMDPLAQRFPRYSCSVSPPTRGWTYRPSPTRGAWLVHQVSPPTRGWTVNLRDPLEGVVTVSPPTRGWTLDCIPSSTDRHGFPRPRGDGPILTITLRTRVVGFPAHAGMDLHHRERGRIEYGGFPAHAGMDPSSSRTPQLRQGFPAHAGMDPRTASAWTVRQWLLGFPAHAGMDPPSRFPRPRGDGPFTPGASVSPPTRGWTLNRREPTGVGGFPAHAGMDPAPRQRADGGLDGFPAHAGMDPPCRRTRCGFPAHAGMDPMTRACAWVSPPTRGWT